MTTVVNKYNITKKKLQEFLVDSQLKLEIKDNTLEKLIKSVKSNYITKNMRIIFYQECLKKINCEKTLIKNKYSQLEINERITIEILHTAKFKQSFIANFLDRNRSTIKREINKNQKEILDLNCFKSPRKHLGTEYIIYYSANEAQKNHDKKRLNSRKKYIFEKHPLLLKLILFSLKDKTNMYSPEVISNYLKEGKFKETTKIICAKTIYNAADRIGSGISRIDLPHKRRYYKKQKNVHTLTKEVSDKKKEISIEKMPEDIKTKITYFEGDSVVGKREGSNNTLITLANPLTQFLIMRRSNSKKAESTVEVMNNLENEIKNFNNIIETILFDNGVEFSYFDKMMKSSNKKDEKRFQIYFAHPYASYERGCNENKNKMIRRFIPKGTDINTITDERIAEIERIINNTPRKKLGFKTPLEMYKKELIKKGKNIDFLKKYEMKLPNYLIA